MVSGFDYFVVLSFVNNANGIALLYVIYTVVCSKLQPFNQHKFHV